MSGQSNVIDNTVAAIMKATVERTNKDPATRLVLRHDAVGEFTPGPGRSLASLPY
jgi:hypothetical protein